jgi:hypothetical protein
MFRLGSEELKSLRTLSRPEQQLLAAFLLPPTPQQISHLVPAPILPRAPRSTLEDCEIGDFRWHDESLTMGKLDKDGKAFTKLEFDGRLSMVTESSIHKAGKYRYAVYIEEGPMSVADGFGFVFSNSLPCKKNIQKIDSIFVNKKGKICTRVHNEMEMLNTESIGNIEVGSILELIIDLDSQLASFSLYNPPKGLDSDTISILCRDETASLESVVEKTGRVIGHFCAVLKNCNIRVRFL